MLKKYGFPITTFVYTSNEDMKKAAKQEDCVIRDIKQRNKYGLPLMSFVMRDLKMHSNTSFVGYINSDILLNPKIFSLLSFVSLLKESKKIRFPVSLKLIFLL